MSIPKKVRDALKERASIDDYPCCEICGTPGANNAHHRRNQSRGGEDRLSNLMLLCGSGVTGCHGVVTAHPEYAHACGWTLWDGEKSFARPVIYRNDGRFLLDDAGGITPARGAA